MGKSKKIRWWEKQWDKTFKMFLHQETVVTPKFIKTLNDVAKEEIDFIVEKEKKNLTQNWNIYANANNRRLEKPHENKKEIEKLVKHFEYEIIKMHEVVGALKQLKTKL
jgi:hypothetical protein